MLSRYKMVFIVFSILLSGFASASNLECRRAKIRFWKESKSVETLFDYCSDSKGTRLVSYNCTQEHNCEILAAIRSKSGLIDVDITTVGNPGFNICYKIGGKPKIVEFQLNNQWVKLDWCFFERDQSFINTGYLFRLMKGGPRSQVSLP